MFKPGNPIIWFIPVLCILLTVPAFGQEKLTLAEAAARALESNPDLAVDAPGIQAAQADFKAARAGYLPRIDFEQSYQNGNNPAYVFSTLLSQERFTAANFDISELNSPTPEDNWQTRVKVQQNIWDFGRTSTRREMAEMGIRKTNQAHEEHVRQVLLAVIDAYYATTLSKESLSTARLALQSAESIESQAKARVDQGLAVEADLLRSQVYVSTAKQQVIQASGNLENAQARLNRLMGKPLAAPIGETSALAPGTIHLPSEEALLAEQKQRRPDYQTLLTELKQAELAVRAQKREFLPVIGGFGSWEADNPALDTSGGNNWSAGVTLSWNVFAGGSRTAQLDAARLRMEQMRRQVAAMESAMALEIRSALIQYRAAEQQVAAAQAAVSQSEEGFRILKNRYDVGLATMTDLLSAETSRSSARTGLSEAVYRQRLHYAEVEYVAGVLSQSSPAVNMQ
jgi:outer membrane protein